MATAFWLLRSGFGLRVVCVGLALVAFVGCKEGYRVGEYVWVEWDGRDYPAYIIEKKDRTRFRVHFDGYDTRWDDDVTIDRIKGRVEGEPKAPPPPDRVARALGLRPKPSASASTVSPFKIGDRVRVRWRGSIYSATVVEVVSSESFRVHYDGYGSEWDETVSEERIIGRR